MRTLYANAYVVTMDDAGTEYANGWLLADDGFVEEVGDGNPPPAEATRRSRARTSAARSSRPVSSTPTTTSTRRSRARVHKKRRSSSG